MVPDERDGQKITYTHKYLHKYKQITQAICFTVKSYQVWKKALSDFPYFIFINCFCPIEWTWHFSVCPFHSLVYLFWLWSVVFIFPSVGYSTLCDHFGMFHGKNKTPWHLPMEPCMCLDRNNILVYAKH